MESAGYLASLFVALLYLRFWDIFFFFAVFLYLLNSNVVTRARDCTGAYPLLSVVATRVNPALRFTALSSVQRRRGVLFRELTPSWSFGILKNRFPIKQLSVL